jgi:outer membrane receptor protein involved in Fe transport
MNSQTGNTTNEEGFFSFETNLSPPITIVVSSLGYQENEFIIVDDIRNPLVISLWQQHRQVTNDIVVTASRRPESFLKSPISIEKLDSKAIKESTAPTFFDALENVKGVQMTTLSLTYKVPNIRGFTGTTNSRFLQLVDGVDQLSPGLGAPIGNTVGPSDLDVESVELIPGVASALYGLNAVNGIANIKTKSPFKYEGFSVLQRTGVNHINSVDQSASVIIETALRFAKTFGKHWAVELNGDYNQGWDGVANNLRDQNPNANASVGLTGDANPGKDLINVYGDESSDRKTLSLNGKNYVVSRTGYAEKDLADYHLKNWKADASLLYRFGDDNTVSYTYRTGEVSNLYQRGNRIQLNGLWIQQHSVELSTKKLTLRGYYTSENTGSSYNLRPLAENLDRSFKDNNTWFNDYRNAYLAATSNGKNDADAHVLARASADQGRLQPSTEAFNAKKDELIRINNWDQGAALVMNTAYAHAEGQYDFSELTPGIHSLVGFNYRNYIVHPDGNSFINPESVNDVIKTGEPFYYYSYGGFAQFEKTFFNDRLKLLGSIRADKVQYFEPKVNPRIAAVYTLLKTHNIRASYQNGYRFPTLFEAFSYVDNGGVKRLGGLPVLASNFGVVENSWLRSSQEAFIAAVNSDVNKNGLSQSDAILKNKSILQKSNYDYIRPEHINSFEAGYRGTFLHDKLFIDADYYFNVYQNFIGQVELTKPNSGIIGQTDSTAFYAYDKTKSSVFRLWTNSTSLVSNQGASLGLTYNFYRKFTITANTSCATLVQVSGADALIPAFNTPQWITNISLGNNYLSKNFGFNLSYHWQSAFDWQSPLANGRIPAYGTFGAQLTYRAPKILTTIKVGSNNLFNKQYYQYEGGPVIDGLYYLTVVFDNPLRNK